MLSALSQTTARVVIFSVWRMVGLSYGFLGMQDLPFRVRAILTQVHETETPDPGTLPAR